MTHAALGFRAHSGWTALVAVSLEKDQPRVLVRQRPKLVETFTYEFRQPYHTAEKMPLDKARDFVSRIEEEAKRLAEGVIRPIQTDLRKRGSLIHVGGTRMPRPACSRSVRLGLIVFLGACTIVLLAQSSVSAQLFTFPRQDLVDYTAQSPFDRLPDGPA